MGKKNESPLQFLLDKLNENITSDDISNKELARQMCLADEARAGLLEPGGLPENDWWANEAIDEFSRIIIKANYRVQTSINPDIRMPSLEDQISEELVKMKELKDAA